MAPLPTLIEIASFERGAGSTEIARQRIMNVSGRNSGMTGCDQKNPAPISGKGNRCRQAARPPPMIRASTFPVGLKP
jgi:hypothetical protein